MAKQRLDLTLSVWGDPSPKPHEDGGTGDSISNLTEAIQMVADCWPGVEVIDPCLFKREDGDNPLPSDEILQKRGILRDSSDRYLELVVDGIIAQLRPLPDGATARYNRDEIMHLISRAMTAATAGKAYEPEHST